ncbi:MAG: MBL fold metallo-hydrolase [Turneriella sp.]|nr:MBL fold metallo-hydrolase [Turneriella sp.]
MLNTLEIKNLRRYTTEHHNGRRFRNIWGAHPDSEADKFDPQSGDIRHRALDVAGWLLRKGLAASRRGEPASVKKISAADLVPPQTEARAIWLGHACVLLQAGGLNIITDPVFGDRVSPVKFAGPKRLCARALEVAELPHVDAIVLSHNHYDHAESETLKFFAARENPPVFVPLRVAPLMKNFGFAEVHELDWWQEIDLGKFKIACLPAKHFSGRSATDRNETLWASFMISFHEPQRHVYFAGDTAYSPHFTEIAQEYPDIHLTLMPIGAYLPRWFMREVHVSPDEAIRAYEDLSARKMLGIHWGTYDLADEDWDQPRREAMAAAKARGLDLQGIKITGVGEDFVF